MKNIKPLIFVTAMVAVTAATAATMQCPNMTNQWSVNVTVYNTGPETIIIKAGSGTTAIPNTPILAGAAESFKMTGETCNGEPVAPSQQFIYDNPNQQGCEIVATDVTNLYVDNCYVPQGEPEPEVTGTGPGEFLVTF